MPASQEVSVGLSINRKSALTIHTKSGLVCLAMYSKEPTKLLKSLTSTNVSLSVALTNLRLFSAGAPLHAKFLYDAFIICFLVKRHFVFSLTCLHALEPFEFSSVLHLEFSFKSFSLILQCPHRCYLLSQDHLPKLLRTTSFCVVFQSKDSSHVCHG